MPVTETQQCKVILVCLPVCAQLNTDICNHFFSYGDNYIQLLVSIFVNEVCFAGYMAIKELFGQQLECYYGVCSWDMISSNLIAVN